MGLLYPAGTRDGANDQCIDIMTIDDALFEGDETFTVELRDLFGAISGNNETVVTIYDVDST